MNTRARSLAYIVALISFAFAACTPAATSEPDRAAATAPAVTAEPTDATAAETAYPPPMQTAKSVAATELTERKSAMETASAVGLDEPIAATDMVRYTNPVLGLSFAYPRELGEVEFDVRPGETGEAWRLGFSRVDALSLEGVTLDYSEGREGMASDTYGFARSEDGGMRWLNVPARPRGSEVDFEEVVTSVSGTEIVVFLLPPERAPAEVATPGPPAALVNLAGDHFPGLIVLNRAPARLPAETLRAILNTIEVTEPTQTDVATATPAEG